jgi:5-methylcytosine-specific restriction endonuclease McrA
MKLTIEEQRQRIREKGESTQLLSKCKRRLINGEVKYIKKSEKVTFDNTQINEAKRITKRSTKKKYKRWDKRNNKKNKLTEDQLIKKRRNFIIALYRTQSWINLRELALKRDKFTCQSCGSTKNLHVHHKKYGKSGTNYLIVDLKHLITVCKKCHEAIHGRSFK